MTVENLSNSLSAAERNSRAIERRTKELLQAGRIYNGSAIDMEFGER
jgi:hypothetical protein